MASDEQRKGTRCAVCVMCGKCFDDEASAAPEAPETQWSGKRCEVCVSCGRCAQAWGLVGGENADALTGPTVWGGAAKAMDTGAAGAPPPITAAPGVDASHVEDGASGATSVAREDASSGAIVVAEKGPDQESKKRPSSFACLKRGADGEEPDTSTGATPGVSSSCKEHGLDDMGKLIADLGIKPPGVA